MERIPEEGPAAVAPKLGRLDRLHYCVIEKNIEGFHLHRTQQAVLMALFLHGKPLTQTALSALFEVSPAAMAVTLRKMEQAGLVERKRREGNARAKEISMTEKGGKMAEETKEVIRNVNAVMTAGLSEEELNMFSRVTDKMAGNLRAAYPDAARAMRCPAREEGEDE